MKMKLILCLTLVLSSVLTGCVATSSKPVDVRGALLESAKKSKPDFPDGRNLVLTRFAEIGQLVTSRGDVIYVIEQYSVTADAMSPHGQAFIVFFDKKFQFLGKMGFGKSYPL